jgi:hypothetical protein
VTTVPTPMMWPKSNSSVTVGTLHAGWIKCNIRARRKGPRNQWCSRRFAILFAIVAATNLVASAQFMPSGPAAEPTQSAPSDRGDKSLHAGTPSLLKTLKSQELEAPYRPITTQESFRWFITGTIGLPHRVGGILVSAFGTAVDRPKEYGPHWAGAADRYGMRIACSATGNAMEAAASLLLREDPRYFRVPDRPFKTRTGNVVRLTFTSRAHDGSFRPAYARYAASFGNNFLSNTWRVQSEANAQHALLRTVGDFAGRTAANAWEEFWPDVKRRVFTKHN